MRVFQTSEITPTVEFLSSEDTNGFSTEQPETVHGKDFLMDSLFHKELQKAKLKLRKGKQNFCNDDTDINRAVGSFFMVEWGKEGTE